MHSDDGQMWVGTPEGETKGYGSLPTLGEVCKDIERRFDEHGAMGVLLIDASVLNRIERHHGDQARVDALNALAALVHGTREDRLEPDDLVVLGEVGRSEVVVLLFRSPGSAAFYRTGMPGFDQSLRRTIAERGGKDFYPYLRRAPRLWTGMSIGLRNPQFSVQTQLRELVEEARGDADLSRRLATRDGRRQLTELILDQSIYSVYEPIVDVATRTVFGYEALARGPEGTPFHTPVALFGAAEEHDLVFELDCVCRASGLRGAIDFPEGTKLFLNVLPTTIHDPNFRTDRLIETLAECRLSPQDVVFEISEQESIRDFAAFREMRDEYRTLGFQFALDDTGSGYAGLEELIELQPEYIKMDRNMVSGVDEDPARQEVLTALLGIAEKMGSRVIGEGLDRLEELEMLGELGIHFGQGWLFGHPTPLRAAKR
jgi:EAL domain-containing protein (putative c-di-GMP-specific phosphodiesterase class I)